jgi:gluconokinase
MIIIVMGVSGAGKTTVGRLLAEDLTWPFFEGDDFHPPANVAKMSEGIPLTDEDRWPWLDSLRKLISGLVAEGQDAVIACSALKQAYRDRLQQSDNEVVFAYLKGNYETIADRLAVRQDHFMSPDLLAPQFSTLEEPQIVLTVGIDQGPSAIVRAVKEGLNL